jgi:alanine racemase
LIAAENPKHDSFTQTQLDRFDQMCTVLQSGLGYVFVRHAANTAAISRHPSSVYEMVRLGIGLYGIDTGGIKKDLIEAVQFKTTVAQLKWVKAGETVGYGRHFILEKDTYVATIRAGYADGLPRSLGNGHGKVMIRQQLFPIIGNICMDMTMVDVSSCSSIQVDDEVILFGKGLSLVDVARDAQTIPYEIMTGISQRVPRIYLSD